jgi:hypothetical protein
LVVKLTGTAPFVFRLQGDDGTDMTITTSLTTYTIPVKPEGTTTYWIASLFDNNSCNAVSTGLPMIVYVSHLTEISSLVATCGEVVGGVAPTARVYFFGKSVPSGTTQVTITFADGSGAQNVTIYTEGEMSYADFTTPTEAGFYDMLLIMNDCEYPFTLMVMQSNNGDNPLVLQRWDDVVVVNNNPKTNGGYTFTSYQWYKDGQLIEGATGPFYQEETVLRGNYSVMLNGTLADGTEFQFMTCEAYFAGKTVMKVYPVPAQLFQSITIETGLTDEELDGAVLDIYTVLGQHLKHVNVVSNTIRIEGFAVPGSYVGKITTATKEVKSIKIVVVK